MNQKHLLRFIKKKIKTNSDDVVIDSNGIRLTLQQLFEEMNLRSYDLNVDTLDVHAVCKTFLCSACGVGWGVVIMCMH